MDEPKRCERSERVPPGMEEAGADFFLFHRFLASTIGNVYREAIGNYRSIRVLGAIQRILTGRFSGVGRGDSAAGRGAIQRA